MPVPQTKNDFLLNPEIAYLNFGSFGACPKPIFDDYQKWQLELEYEPVQFIATNGVNYLKAARGALADYLNCDTDDLVYVTNPSYGINIIAKSLNLSPGDEVLTTNLEYGALDRTWNYYCKKAGANYVRQEIHLPIQSKEQVVEDFFKGLSPRTKAVFISHITSTTALILPVKEICDRARSKGILTIVDGAHVPGHIPLNLKELDADIYTGACHKWMLTPKGCSFLYVRKDLQKLFDPLVVSWGYEALFPSSSQFLDYHQMQGTRDISAFLTVPRAISYMIENNWNQVSADCRKMVKDNAPRFCDLLATEPLCPLTDEFLGQMFSLPINPLNPERLQRYFYQTYNVEVPVMRHDDKAYLRYSINAFNTQDDLDRLYYGIKEILEVTDFIELPKKSSKT